MQGCGDFFLFRQIATLHKVVILLVSFVIFFFQFLYLYNWYGLWLCWVEFSQLWTDADAVDTVP